MIIERSYIMFKFRYKVVEWYDPNIMRLHQSVFRGIELIAFTFPAFLATLHARLAMLLLYFLIHIQGGQHKYVQWKGAAK